MNYRHALDVAIAAARDAGDILRHDLHLPSGPRGGGDKADADTEAEHVIRARVTEAFPECAFVGEETGRHAIAADAPHVWLVDPNDGTRSYTKGYRGSAVSIGLLRDGIPVLGVVYAFAAPDDAGDLFAWGEGCGPLVRNGRAVVDTAWPSMLGTKAVVLQSDSADRRPDMNAHATAPGRFRAVPSIAYRLALAAVGDACAAVSLHGPGAWDYAGAHALLRAVGGDLLDQDGEPVRYTRDGKSRTRFCFGGQPAIVRELRRRDWPAVLGGSRPTPQPYELAWPERGQLEADTGRLGRAQGCLLGQIAGDALGGLVEFGRPEGIRAQYPDGVRLLEDGGHWNTLAGQPTDDSELALMLARSIIASGQYDAEAAAQAYTYWYRSDPFDCGATIGQALGAVSSDDVTARRTAAVARTNASTTSRSNGSLMRVSPLGVWGHQLSPDRLAGHARDDAAITHGDPLCGDAGAVFVVAIARAMAAGGAPREVYEFARAWAARAGVHGDVLGALERASSEPPGDFLTQPGWILIAFQNAFYRLLHAPSLEDGVVQTVSAGGDADTNAAIAGALLGAVHGRECVPLQWRQMILSCHPVNGLGGVRHPRPRGFWPVDALTLAERLLTQGARRV